MRASHRALDDERSTDLHPVPLHTEEAAEPLPEGEFVSVPVDIFPFAHVFRAGSRLRLYIDTPGGNRTRWAFDTLDAAGQANLVASSSDFPSSLTVGVVADIEVPAELPACGALRAQPCRRYRARRERPRRLTAPHRFWVRFRAPRRTIAHAERRVVSRRAGRSPGRGGRRPRG